MSWGEVCDRLDIKRSMLHYLRTGDRQPSPKLLRKLELLEAEHGLRRFSAPSSEPVSRLRFLQFIRQCDWSEIALDLGMEEAGIHAVLRGTRTLTEKESKSLSTLESAVYIDVPSPPPTLGKPTQTSVQRLDKSSAKVPTIGNPPPEWAQRLEEKVDELLAWIRKQEKKPKGRKG